MVPNILNNSDPAAFASVQRARTVASNEGPLFARSSRSKAPVEKAVGAPHGQSNPSADETESGQVPRPVQPTARSRLLACQTLSFSVAPLFAGSIASSWPASLAVSSMT